MNDMNTSISADPINSAPTVAAPASRVLPLRAVPKVVARDERRLVVMFSLMAVDIAVVFASMNVAESFVGGLGSTSLPVVPFLAGLAVLANFTLGLYGACGPSPYERLRLRASGVLFVLAASLVLQGVLGLGPRALGLACFGGILLLLLGYYGEGAARRVLVRCGLWGATAVLVGRGPAAQDLARKLIAEPELGLRPVGFLRSPDDTSVDSQQVDLPILGSVTERGQFGESVEVVIFTSTRHFALLDEIRRSLRAQVFLVEDTQGQSLWLRTRAIGAAVGVEIRHNLGLRRNLYLKRAIDLIISVPLGLVVIPLIALSALAIKAVSPGPAFYVQERIGRNGRPFRVLKLRSMYTDAERRLEDYLAENKEAREEWQHHFKLTNDPRVLPIVGAIIRKSSVDELPQLWNVLRGEMSLVGPRPFPLYHTSSFDRTFQTTRESVPPGLTGFWQVSSRSAGNLDIQREQDLFYIKNWSIWLDFYIILQTIPAILSARGAK